eukprot:CAMPEP_0167766900 /NCGR_PEP_ID=MMETSP0110_2-20121227/15677_1 /TAXON_ID=629695 /ORGANISM="Gymnochlora sp., Strain CCMP2014" /LENGTH=600 /DNA_ID=CAMNT_0007655131 /DNA_START=240 /DNA_END=2042 /DNA_ORIENTATION=-
MSSVMQRPSVAQPVRIGHRHLRSEIPSRFRVGATVGKGQTSIQSEEDFYKESWFDKTALGLFRYLVQKGTGYKSNLKGYEGLKDEAKQYMVDQRASPEEQQQMVLEVLKTIAGPFPPLYKAFMTRIPTPLASFFTALFTPTVFGFLVGPSALNSTRDLRPFQGVRVERCRFLYETGCKGLCVNMCKIPTQRFFEEEMGFPMEMRPNFETCECTLSYGVAPIPLEQDSEVPKPCLTGCPSLTELGNDSPLICNAQGAGSPMVSPVLMMSGNDVEVPIQTSEQSIGISNGSPPGNNNSEYPNFIPKEYAMEIEEEACQDILKTFDRIPVSVPFSDKPILTPVTPIPNPNTLGERTPMIFLHGFDSSVLEFRRILPKIREVAGDILEPEAIDLLGWGFATAETPLSAIGPVEKREHLYAYWKQYVKKPMIICGASLGGAIAIDFAINHPDAVKGMVLMDAQAYIDGVQTPPEIFMDLGLNVLKSRPLRQIANVQSYCDRDKYATEDAVRIGMLHTYLPNWKEYNKKWMRGGGYSLSKRISEVDVPTLILWGDQDNILGTDVAENFKRDIPNSELIWVPQCGHVPHLEQAEFTAEKLKAFASSL